MTKELRLPSAYVEVKENEMEYLDGSFGFLAGLVISWGIEAGCQALTGKSTADNCLEGWGIIGSWLGL